jgi:hypothetical protein
MGMDKEKLKRQHGPHLHVVTVKGEDGELVFVFKRPDRSTLAAAAKFASTDPIRAAEVMIETCLVEGDKTALEDITVFQAVAEAFGELNRPREFTLVKL